jgi:hypothetical protein
VYERASAARDEAALYIVLEGKGLVLATPAEMDGVLRVLREGPDVGRLEAPPRGLVSFAGRVRMGDKPPPLPAVASVREVGVGLLRYTGSVEAGDDALRLEAELVYQADSQAQRAAEVVRSVLTKLGRLGSPYVSLSDSAKLAAVGKSLELRLSVPFALITSLD